MLKKFNVERLLILILIPQAVGLLSSWLAGDIMGDFNGLIKPPFTIPAIAFPIVWGILFLLMGIASYLVFPNSKVQRNNSAFYYFSQLGINFLWPLLFFGLEIRLFALFWILLLIVFVYLTIKSFFRYSKVAAYLMLPYFIYLFYGAYLNLGFWYLNK